MSGQHPTPERQPLSTGISSSSVSTQAADPAAARRSSQAHPRHGALLHHAPRSLNPIPYMGAAAPTGQRTAALRPWSWHAACCRAQVTEAAVIILAQPPGGCLARCHRLGHGALLDTQRARCNRLAAPRGALPRLGRQAHLRSEQAS